MQLFIHFLISFSLKKKNRACQCNKRGFVLSPAQIEKVLWETQALSGNMVLTPFI